MRFVAKKKLVIKFILNETVVDIKEEVENYSCGDNLMLTKEKENETK